MAVGGFILRDVADTRQRAQKKPLNFAKHSKRS